MRVDVAVVADYASITQEGKLILSGAFDRVAAMQLPWRHPTMTLVIRLALEPGEPRSFTVAANLVDDDGQPVVPPMEQRVELPEVAGGGQPSANLLFTMNGLLLPHAGAYAFEVFVDGSHTRSVPFEVTAPPGGGAAEGEGQSALH
ncbi:MAG: hypothetical protein FDZ70_08090 [Actinobacteria bacterium]|nr:MAG: hypothetical protein FDZ70_08090 [Actinomycetota bacterium]